jgi:hypothetical protein
VILAASLNPEHWLCFGLPMGVKAGDKCPVLLLGSYAFMSKHPVATPVRLVDKGGLRMAGLL